MSFIKCKLLFTALLITAAVSTYANTSSKVESTVKEIVTKYEGVKGVECMTVVKGQGLELIKMTLNREFGRSFMKGVRSITIIEYSDASKETCESLHKDLDLFINMLQEFDLSKEESFSENNYIRCFAAVADSGTLSDFVVALEQENSKVVMYMAGTIKVE